jgi:hypothetical protein
MFSWPKFLNVYWDFIARIRRNNNNKERLKYQLYIYIYIYIYIYKGNAISVTDRRHPYGSEALMLSHLLYNPFTDGGVVSLTSTPDSQRQEGLCRLKKCNYIENGTSDDIHDEIKKHDN